MYCKSENFTLYHGDNRQILPTFAENSVDAIVTDPPYELGFMGKSWDASGVAFDPATWREALRVLKPGGHLIAFSGSRTYHRMAVAIEDAGFEIRDQIMWIYGSGFPKSHNVSKGIDKRGGSIPSQNDFGKFLQDAKSKTKFTIADINEALGRRTSNLWSHFVGDIQPLLPTFEQYAKLKEILQFDDFWDYLFIDEAEREVVGKGSSTLINSTGTYAVTNGEAAEEWKPKEYDLTAPATEAAKQWDGWGTALKPAHEPMVLARKPLIGTVAANVLTYGTGGLNIDGSRVGTEESLARPFNEANNQTFGKYENFGNPVEPVGGRWPANVIHDGSDEVVALFPDKAGGGHWSKTKVTGYGEFGGGKSEYFGQGEKDGFGSAARFFYCAKASKRDRNEGLDGFEAKNNGKMMRNANNTSEEPSVGFERFATEPSANHHPTVKPTDLMRYLCRLITPPNGTVLDPFMGSGSTGKAAMYEGFKFIGVEMTDEYLPIAKARIEFAVSDNEGFLL